jgi:hypothetical protein
MGSLRFPERKPYNKWFGRCNGCFMPEKSRIAVFDFMRVEYYLTGDRYDGFQRFYSDVGVSEEYAMLKSLDLLEVFEPFPIPEIAPRFEIAKDIERHGIRCRK